MCSSLLGYKFFSFLSFHQHCHPPGSHLTESLPIFLPFSSERLGPLAHQVSEGLGASFPTKASQGSLVGKWILQSGYSFRDSPYTSCWGTHMEIGLQVFCICV